jgi:hypothetical protein
VQSTRNGDENPDLRGEQARHDHRGILARVRQIHSISIDTIYPIEKTSSYGCGRWPQLHLPINAALRFFLVIATPLLLS